MITFSLSYRKVTVKNSAGQSVVAYKAYATARAQEKMDSETFLDHTARQVSSMYTRADARAILSQLAQGIADKVADGYKVPIPGLGYCYPSLSAFAVDSAEDFKPAQHVKKVSVGWTKAAEFADFKNSNWDVTYKQILTDVNENSAIQANNTGQNSFTLHSTPSKEAAFE